MNIQKYMTQNCLYEEKLDDDNEFVPTGSYKEPESIPCFSFGSRGIQISAQSEVSVRYNKTISVVDKRVKQGDRINGQIVDSVIEYLDFNGEVLYKDCMLKG